MKNKNKSRRENLSVFARPFESVYVNEEYALMHDPIRIITLPAALRAGVINSYAETVLSKTAAWH